MKTRKIKVYGISELSEKAQQTAYYDWCSNGCYFWADDNRKTLTVFENIFPVKVKDYEYGGCTSGNISWSFVENDDIAELHGIRLLKYLVNNYWSFLFKGKYYSSSMRECPKDENHPAGLTYTKRYSKCQFETCCVLTGYCIDDDILQPIYDFLKNPKDNITFHDLMNECLHEWVFACQKDFEFSTSREAFIEHAEANEYEYTANGKLF